MQCSNDLLHAPGLADDRRFCSSGVRVVAGVEDVQDAAFLQSLDGWLRAVSSQSKIYDLGREWLPINKRERGGNRFGGDYPRSGNFQCLRDFERNQRLVFDDEDRAARERMLPTFCVPSHATRSIHSPKGAA